jgi:hypothetical protein
MIEPLPAIAFAGNGEGRTVACIGVRGSAARARGQFGRLRPTTDLNG